MGHDLDPLIFITTGKPVLGRDERYEVVSTLQSLCQLSDAFGLGKVFARHSSAGSCRKLPFSRFWKRDEAMKTFSDVSRTLRCERVISKGNCLFSRNRQGSVGLSSPRLSRKKFRKKSCKSHLVLIRKFNVVFDPLLLISELFAHFPPS